MSNTKDIKKVIKADPTLAMQILKQLMGSEISEKDAISEVIVDAKSKQITIPQGMDKLTAAKELTRQYEEEEQLVNANYSFKNWEIHDVLHAIKQVTINEFGWMNAKTTYGFFGPNRPNYISVVTDVVNGKNITEECFYGQFVVTLWDEADGNINVSRSGVVSVNFELKGKFRSEAARFFALVEDYLKQHSIYKGKSVVLRQDATFGAISYRIIENIPNDKIFLNPDAENVIQRWIIDDLDSKEKRTYLFTGHYGGGKTETAMAIGKQATKKGMTFMYVKDNAMLERALILAGQYSPCLLFMEDIDETTSSEERDSNINSVLNTLDGVETKSSQIKTIFTTNNQDSIHPALRRPGRLDLIVNFDNPEPEVRVKILEAHLHDVKGWKQIDKEKLASILPDASGASIAEIAKRAKKLSQRDKETNFDSIRACVTSLTPQLELMRASQKSPQTVEKKLFDAIASAVKDGIRAYNEE